MEILYVPTGDPVSDFDGAFEVHAVALLVQVERQFSLPRHQLLFLGFLAQPALSIDSVLGSILTAAVGLVHRLRCARI